jgi:serine/threonine-protein kinase ATR
MSSSPRHRIIADTARAKYSSLPDDPKQNEDAQEQLLMAFGKVACAGSRCLQTNNAGSDHWQKLGCVVCDKAVTTKNRKLDVHWDKGNRGEDWKDVVAALLMITKEPKFQNSTTARVLMAVAIGRLFNHIGDPDYLNLDKCELGQWLLVSLSRSLRELKITAVCVYDIPYPANY